jgi:hypothetical protein
MCFLKNKKVHLLVSELYISQYFVNVGSKTSSSINLGVCLNRIGGKS